MTIYSSKKIQFGIKKEAVRGTAETAPDVWFPVRELPEIDLNLEHLEDEGLRGSLVPYPPVAGMKVGEASIAINADPEVMGEIFYSLMTGLGSAQQGGTAAYLHTFTISELTQKIAYTLFLDRNQGILKYNRAVCKTVEIVGSVDGLIEMNTTWIFENEASGSIGSPSYPTQRYFAFNQVDFKIAGSSNTKVKEFSLTLDNNAMPLRTLNGSQLVEDVITADKFSVEGSFTVYFENTTERDKFLANTAASIQIILTGAEIANPYNYVLDINIYAAHYKAFPYREDENLLAAQVEFKGYYSSGDSKMLQVDLTNTVVSY